MARTGRPTKINEVIATRPILDPETREPTGDVEEITVADQIIADVRAGMYAERAARRAGIATSTFYDWEKIGRETRRRLDLGETTLSSLRVKERRCLEFSEALEVAEAEWETRKIADLERLARGGVVQEEVVVKVDADGNELERRTKRTASLPDKDVIRWQLRHRLPAVYTDRVQVEGTGEDGAIDVRVRAENLAGALREHLERTGSDG